MVVTNGHKKTAVLYCRVSTSEQAEKGYSLAQQLEALRQYADREGYEVLEEVTDPGQSGARLERPGMDRVRDLVATGGVSVVLAKDRDRFAREPAYHYLLKQEFAEYATEIRALNDRGDGSPEGELTDGILDQLAKFERAKTAERMRRGKLRKAREGKIVAAGTAPNFGFKYNATRDGYMVDEEKMRIVRRIFHMVGVEKRSLKGIKKILQAEGVSTPAGNKYWHTRGIREFVLNDVYRPHTYEEIKELVSPAVAAMLDPERRYGIWWFNRERVTRQQVAEISLSGECAYREKVKAITRPKEEWIAVPVPDSGIPREVVDAARAAIADNKPASSNGHRFWELSGGILRCAVCGLAMRTHVAHKGNKRFYYYLCRRRHEEPTACHNRKHQRAEKAERQVRELVYEAMTHPEQLRADLDRMIELKRQSLRGDPNREAKVWLDKLTELDRKRSGYIDLAADGIMDRDELRAKLAALEETRETARRELEALSRRQEEIAALERDRDALLEFYINTAPEALECRTPEERHQFYKMGRLVALAGADGRIEVTGPLVMKPEVCNSDGAYWQRSTKS
jgi:site-specific DNA recombinase